MNDFERIYQQLDRIEDTLERVRPELVAIKSDLTYHIKRTDLLEAEMKHLDRDVTKLRGFFSIGGWLLGIAATLLTIASKMGLL